MIISFIYLPFYTTTQSYLLKLTLLILFNDSLVIIPRTIKQVKGHKNQYDNINVQKEDTSKKRKYTSIEPWKNCSQEKKRPDPSPCFVFVESQQKGEIDSSEKDDLKNKFQIKTSKQTRTKKIAVQANCNYNSMNDDEYNFFSNKDRIDRRHTPSN